MNKFSITGNSAAASLTGFASNVTGATFTLTANDAGDSLAHKVTVKNDSATDHSGKTIELVGTGPQGEAQTETLTGPGSSATVTSTKYFKTLTSATPSASIGADTFDIGWAVASVSAWKPLDKSDWTPAGVGFACIVDSGSPTYTAQYCMQDGTAFDHATVASETTSQAGSITTLVQAVRLSWAAAGGVTMHGMY